MGPSEFITLRDYIDIKVTELEKAVVCKITALEALHMRDASTLEKRLDGMNEWRQERREQNAEFLPRTEYDIQHQKLVDDIRLLRESKATLEGKASQNSVIFLGGVSVISLVIAAIALFH